MTAEIRLEFAPCDLMLTCPLFNVGRRLGTFIWSGDCFSRRLRFCRESHLKMCFSPSLPPPRPVRFASSILFCSFWLLRSIPLPGRGDPRSSQISGSGFLACYLTCLSCCSDALCLEESVFSLGSCISPPPRPPGKACLR